MSKKTSARRKSWRACAGVNKRTGRVKKGYKMVKGGSCPTHVGSHKPKRMSRMQRIASHYHSGARSYAANYMPEIPDNVITSINGFGRSRRRRRRRR